MKSKTCTLCKLEKPMSDYGSHSRAVDGKQTRCKQCLSKIARRKRQLAPRHSERYALRVTLVDIMMADSDKFIRSLP